MNYKKLLSTVFLSAALSLSAGAYTVTAADGVPQWQIDWSGNQERPGWTAPDGSTFENWSVMLVKIEDTLHPYVSADDLLALFVDDEMRGLASPSVDVSTDEVDATQFLMKIYGNENYGDEVVITMKYYNAQLRQQFTLSETMTLDEDVLVGFDEDFIPAFTLGSKFTMTTTLDVTATIASVGAKPANGDVAAVFVGDDCRGVVTMANGQWPLLDVYLSDADEPIVLKYYDATGKRIYTFEGNFTGDANRDGTTDVADISAVITVMSHGNAGDSPASADVNGDGVIDVADIATVIDIMSVK